MHRAMGTQRKQEGSTGAARRNCSTRHAADTSYYGEQMQMDRWETETNQKKKKDMPKKGNADQGIIGPYTKASKREKGNGAQLRRICRRQQTIPMTTWREPRIEGKDKWRQPPKEETKENWERTPTKIHHNMDQPGWKHKKTD